MAHTNAKDVLIVGSVGCNARVYKEMMARHGARDAEANCVRIGRTRTNGFEVLPSITGR